MSVPASSTPVTTEPINTHQKALQVNLDAKNYGTFAEIGAGQEVARWFFRVGGASGTIAKTISAYDMMISDAIYGHSERYVSSSASRHAGSRVRTDDRAPEYQARQHYKFFVFADTVTTRSFLRNDEGTRLDGYAIPDRAPLRAMPDHHSCPHAGCQNIQQQEAWVSSG